MNKLVPLLDASPNSRTRALLRAGRADTPPSGFSERLLVGLGASAAVSTAASVAAASGAGAAIHGAASTGSGAVSLALVTAKWVAVGVLGGGILAGGAELAFSTRTSASSATAVSRGAPRAAAKAPARPPTSPAPDVAVATPPESPLVAPAAPVPRTTASYVGSTAGGAPAPSAPQGQLGREVQAIDFARHALASGDFARALSELDAFERMPQTGVLEREAKVLRIETLYKLGQASRAQALSEQYLQAFPNDAHTARLRALGQAAPAR